MPFMNRADAEDFLYQEARLLDERRYRDWLEMFCEPATYWMPCNSAGTDPNREVSLIFDNLPKLRDRIDRFVSGLAHAQNPPSRTNRLISNVRVESAREMEAMLSSGFILYELRRHKERLYSGRYEHSLVRVNEKWKIASKKVVLVNNDEVIDNLTFIV
jgi:3-phenylpropionate/cinnamic acid dioxygenase small subunit